MLTGIIVGAIIGLLIVNVIIGFLTLNLHSLKGYDGGFLVGLFLGIIGLLYSVGLPDVSRKKLTQDASGATIIDSVDNGTDNDSNKDSEESKYSICPECGFPVYDDETHCSNCGKEKIL